MYPARHLDYYLLKPDIIQNKPEAYNPAEIKYLFRGKEIVKLKRKGMLQLIAEFEPSHAITFWNNKFNYMWSIPYKCTKVTRLQTLQWKIMSNINPTNILLNKMGRAPNRNCTRCGQEDSIEHFFAECPAVRPLWTEVANLIAIWLGRRLTLTTSMILLGVEQGKLSSKESKTINLAILIGKLCISKFK